MRRNNDVFKHNEINAVEPPLGGMAILSYLNEKFGDRIYGEIVKTGVDVCVIGEGEIICGDLVRQTLEKGQFPDMEMLQSIKGIAFRSDRQVHPDVTVPNSKNATYACYPLWVRAGTEKAVSR